MPLIVMALILKTLLLIFKTSHPISREF